LSRLSLFWHPVGVGPATSLLDRSGTELQMPEIGEEGQNLL
jgi:hypothetical protein